MIDMEFSICERFNINPFELNKETSLDVIVLIIDLLDYQERKENEKQITNEEGKQIIYKKAGDNWF